jgi:hypothetical protein
MKRFLTTYLLTAVIGTAAVYFGAPAIAARLSGPARPEPDGAPPSVDALTPVSTAPGLAPTVADTPAAGSGDPTVGCVTAPAEAAATPSSPVPEAPVGVPASVIPPYQPPASITNANAWAILTRRAVHYSTAGKNLGSLPAGTIGEVIKTTTSSDGDVAVCLIEQDGQWKGPVLIGVADLVVFENSLAAVPADTLSLLHHYYTLKERIDARAAAIQKAITDANPHAAAYIRATEAVNAFVIRAQKLTAAFKTATGPARTDLLEKLKRMKFEQVRLNAERSEAEARMKEWSAQNPAPPANAASDPELGGWLAELRRIEPRKRAIIP